MPPRLPGSAGLGHMLAKWPISPHLKQSTSDRSLRHPGRPPSCPPCDSGPNPLLGLLCMLALLLPPKPMAARAAASSPRAPPAPPDGIPYRPGGARFLCIPPPSAKSSPCPPPVPNASAAVKGRWVRTGELDRDALEGGVLLMCPRGHSSP